MSDDPKSRNPFEGFRIEIDPEKVDEAVKAIRTRLEALRDRAQEAVAQGQHIRVRVSYKGKPIGPEIPLAALVAGEGVLLMALGPLYLLLGNLGAKAFLDIEFLHDADELVERGKAAWMLGEAEAAEVHYREALAKRKDDPSALYHLGVMLRVTGRVEEATRCFRQAAMGPEGHPDVVRAAEALERMAGKRTL